MLAEQNKAIVRHILEEIWHGNLGILNEHPGMHASIPFLTTMRDSVDFSSQEIVQQLADGNWVVTRFLSSGIHKKDFMGTPAGKEVHIETIMIHHIQDGQMVEQRSQGGPYERR